MIRYAISSDARSIVKEGEKFLQYHPCTFYFDEDHITNFVLNLIKDHLVLIAEDKKDNFIGMIAGMLSPNPYDPTYVMLTELFWWVKEEQRNSFESYKLFKEFEKVGKELKVSSIVMTSTSKTPNLDRIYKKNNYLLYETSYVKEL